MNLHEELDALGVRLHDDISRQLRQFADHLPVAASAKNEAEIDRRAGETLLTAVRAIDEARSLNEVLDALVTGASRQAARAGVLLRQGRRVRGRQFAGFPDAFDATGVDLPLEQSGIIAVAVEHQRAASTASDGPAPPFAELGPEADRTEAVAFPIALGGEVVAVLYVDQPDAEPGIPTLDRAMLEVLARHAARTLEAVTAFKAARALVQADTVSMAVAPATNNGEDEDQAARRFARLVISEIKLYHEDAVTEGRRAGDLASRLGGEIARARAQYEQRVPAHLQGGAEHFHAELVRTLAGGDASLFAKASRS